MSVEEIEQRFLTIRSRIEAAARQSGRSLADITLVAVSKHQPTDRIASYLTIVKKYGSLPVLGENYVQEGKKKRQSFGDKVEMHLIGALQRNKAKDALRIADVIESVHSLDLLKALEHEAVKLHKRQRVFLQVNISADPAKSGFLASEVALAARRVIETSHLMLEGLMTITRQYDDAEMVRPDFRQMVSLARALETTLSLPSKLALSMGMSDDYVIAIEEGATIVRIGSALFGARASVP